ncbi:hypothetical protein [Thalassotalea profundi]|uniref:Lipoprotein n=1 Tax=Thalassotalea profundi TaxID=2036687 RepID=A0ABQ3IXM2_9GAMM|nr:hypothetical protein [Thalassotalea profundi]GHE97507.1 hypothetical protein GCM10011501_28880 [Thalassotalea profundi]
MQLFSVLKITLCFSIILLGACTNKQLYNTIQETNESRCRAKVGPEREQCFAELNTKNYQEYEQARKSVDKDNLH